ncbi:MAG TPA: hypothetical protein DCZ43_00875, partial [candidate division Zixibacteria bacterium]|nr:hypothetical protein [candidate division Zixibacteria bacterium]
RSFAYILALSILICPSVFAKGIKLGLGFDYAPIAKVKYVRNSELNFEIFDNLIWQGKATYDFGNFSAGALFDYLSKTIHPQDYLTTDLSVWGIGACADYGYNMTESGHAQLVGGIETGYARLHDKSGESSVSDGSLWAAGVAGLRFMIVKNLWLETDYKLSWMEFGPISVREKKYDLSGSSLKLALDYQL